MEGVGDVVRLRLQMRSPRADGLSSQEEYPRLCEIDDAITGSLEETPVRIVYVGRTTGGGTRDYYFYTVDATVTESLLCAILAPFSEYEFELAHQEDGQWDTYLELLYPTPRDYQLIKNQLVLEQLGAREDRHNVPRDVCHWAYFAGASDRDAFVAKAIAQGFRLIGNSEDLQAERPFGASVASVTTVDYYTINDVVLSLYDLCQACHGDYDGWETPIVREGDTPPVY